MQNYPRNERYLFCHDVGRNVIERLRTREPLATLQADPAVPAALLVASTVVVVVASVLPGTVGVTFAVGAVLALAAPCFVLLRGRREVWRPVVTTWWGEGVAMVPTLALFGLYVFEVRAPAAGVDVPGAVGPPVLALAFGLWTVYRANRWYVDRVVGEERPFATWAARQSRRRVARDAAFVVVGASLGGLSVTATTADASLLVDAGPTVAGGAFGSLVGATVRARRRHRYGAFESGLRVRSHRFRHREQITGFDLTDRELVIRTAGWFGDVRLRRADLGDVERVRAVLEYYDGTRSRPPERTPVRADESSRETDVPHQW